jgi:hypothetical protein
MALSGAGILFVILVLGTALANYHCGANLSALLLCEWRAVCAATCTWCSRCLAASRASHLCMHAARAHERFNTARAAPAAPRRAVLITVLYFLLALIMALLISGLYMGCSELEPLAVRLAPASMTPLLR